MKPPRFVPVLAASLQRGAAAIAAVFRLIIGANPAPLLPKIFVVVEGTHDMAFLRRISAMLHAHDSRVPDLAALERRHELVFVPCGGGDVRSWITRLAALGRAEFHLFDRDVPPATETRRQALELVNCRPHCQAAMTAKRALENYLHPDAIFQARGIRVEFSDEDDVANVVARAIYERQPRHTPWQDVPAHDRKRRRDKAKCWLNTSAVECMTLERLTKRDPSGELRGWLLTIRQLADGAP